MGWSFLLCTPGEGPVADRRDATMVRFSPDLVPALWFGLFAIGDELDVFARVGFGAGAQGGDDQRPFPCEMLWVPKDVAIERLRAYIDGLRSCRRVRTREDVLFEFLAAASDAAGEGFQLHDAEFQAIVGRNDILAWRRECLVYAAQVRSGLLHGDAVLESGLADEVFEAAGISPVRWRSSRSWEWSLAGWRPASDDRTTEETTLTPSLL
jgi:hypothetical protein